MCLADVIVAEAQATGIAFASVTALDPDYDGNSQEFGINTYELTGDSSFAIRPNSGKLVLASTLDFETT